VIKLFIYILLFIFLMQGCASSNSVIMINHIYDIASKDMSNYKNRALNGDAKYSQKIGNYYRFIESKPEEFRFWIRLAAEQGDPLAALNLGNVMAGDRDKAAIVWLKRAESKFEPKHVVQYELGKTYAMFKDWPNAINSYCKAVLLYAIEDEEQEYLAASHYLYEIFLEPSTGYASNKAAYFWMGYELNRLNQNTFSYNQVFSTRQALAKSLTKEEIAEQDVKLQKLINHKELDSRFCELENFK
jgi:hypothetical protein